MKKLLFVSLCSLFITSYGAEQQPVAAALTHFPNYEKSIFFSAILASDSTPLVKNQEINDLLDSGFDATIINPTTGKLPLTELFESWSIITETHFHFEDIHHLTESYSLLHKIVKDIIEKGHADINQQDHQGHTALVAFLVEAEKAYYINAIIPIFDYLTGLNPDHSKRTNTGQTVMHKMALFLAYLTDDEEPGWMRKLLAQGASIDAQDEKGQTPLILLIRQQKNESLYDNVAYVCKIEYFIDNGANPLLYDNTGHNALHLLAKDHRWKSLAKFLCLEQYRYGAQTLATEKRYSLLDYILNFVFIDDFPNQIEDGDFDEQDFVKCIDLSAQQNCPLPAPHLNSSYESPFGNPINNRSKLHYTVLMAVPSLFTKITAADKEHLKSTDSQGNTPLISACRKLFIPRQWIDQQQQDDFRKRREKDFEQCINHLLTLGANPNAQNIEGNTPLHVAVGTKNIGALKALLKWNKTTKTKKTR